MADSLKITTKNKYFQCHICDLYFHSLCSSYNSNISLNYLYKNWVCTPCLHSIFPFQSLTNNKFSDLFKPYHFTQISTDKLNNLFADINVIIDQIFTDDNDIILHNSMNEAYITTKEVNQMLKNKNYEKKFSTMYINV